MKIIYKDKYDRQNFSEWKFRDEVKKYLGELGYNKIYVES